MSLSSLGENQGKKQLEAATAVEGRAVLSLSPFS